jgi:hypothetical protein
MRETESVKEFDENIAAKEQSDPKGSIPTDAADDSAKA